jgi:CRP/FNR family cyclic AMP-dependent transcriptional regulator
MISLVKGPITARKNKNCENSHRNGVLTYATIAWMMGTQDGEFSSLKEFFARKSTSVRCPKGEVIVQAEDEPFGIFYIESGFVKVFSLNALGTQYIHVIYGPGDYFPMVWFIPDFRRNLYFETMTPATLNRVRPKELHEAMQKNAALSIDAMRTGLEQYGTMLDRVHNLEYRFARERLVYCLLSLARRFGVPKDGCYEITLKISQQILASNINLSRESVGRELDRLVRKDMVEIRSGRICLKDVPALIKQLPGTVSTDWMELAAVSQNA